MRKLMFLMLLSLVLVPLTHAEEGSAVKAEEVASEVADFEKSGLAEDQLRAAKALKKKHPKWGRKKIMDAVQNHYPQVVKHLKKGNGKDKLEDKFDRREDRLDRREDIRDRREDRKDRLEDRRDRAEDVRDARHDGGRLDKLEDRLDHREDRLDRREDVRDRREDRRDLREDRRENRREHHKTQAGAK